MNYKLITVIIEKYLSAIKPSSRCRMIYEKVQDQIKRLEGLILYLYSILCSGKWNNKFPIYTTIVNTTA